MEFDWDETKNVTNKDKHGIDFETAMKLKEDKTCEMYIERCKAFKKNPPPKKWDGVFRLKTK